MQNKYLTHSLGAVKSKATARVASEGGVQNVPQLNSEKAKPRWLSPTRLNLSLRSIAISVP